MLGTILIVVLVLLLLGALGNNAQWGYAPGSGIGLLLAIVLILLILGRL